jgi:patatin-like phospholipase/acyl hydrolase
MSGNTPAVGAPFKILSLDGGGIRGAFSATVLACIEEQTGARLRDYFDLITGTSTGGIIALGLAAGLSASDIRDFYVVDGPHIFPPPTGLRRLARTLISVVRPKYSQRPLAVALQHVFGERTMGDLQTRVVIPTFNANSGRIRLFKTRHHDHISHDHSCTLVDVALATSAAPYFLPGHTTARHERFVDGGIWANDPIAVAVIEAVGYLGVPTADVRVLSLGTTSEPYHLKPGTIGRGIVGLGLGVLHGQSVGLAMAAQMTGAQAQAKVLLGGDEPIMRIDPQVAPGRFKLDRVADIPELCGCAEDAALHAMPRVRAQFLDAPAAHPYVPRP